MKRTIALSIFSAALMVTGATAVQASPLQIRVADSGGNSCTLTDGGGVVACSGAAAASVSSDGVPDGFIQFTGTIGNFYFNSIVGASNPFIGGPNTAAMDLNDFTSTAQSGNGGVLYVTLVNTDFTFQDLAIGRTATVTSLANGNVFAGAGSSISFQSWINTNNQVSLTNPGSVPGDIALYSSATVDDAAGGSMGFGFTGTNSFIYNGAFAIMETATINLKGNGSFASFDSQTNVPVPEAGSLLLLGSGLFGLASMVRKRRQTSV